MNNPQTLFITAFHPGGRGVIGAGEAISEDSIRALHAAGREVHVLCLAPDNQSANMDVLALCKSYTTLPHGVGQAFLGIFRGISLGSFLAPWFFTRVSARNLDAAQKIILEYGIEEVWLDFPSTLGFASHLRVPAIDYFVHDVVAQKIGRRQFLRALEPAVGRIEQKLLRSIRRCFVLSHKDQELLRQMGFGGGIEIQPLSSPRIGEVDNARPVSEIVDAFSGRKNIVFFGNMRRPENHWSILHFVLFGYPKIWREHRDIQFWVIGLSPRMTLRLLGRFVPGLRIVGAIDDPRPAFRAADLCVVPLRLGAGVKIKVLQMLEAGAKVIASPVGGEGISQTPGLLIVPYAEIPAAVCKMLSDLDC